MKRGALAVLLSVAAQGATVTLPVSTGSVREAAISAGPAVPVVALAFQPHGKLLAAAGYREVLLWNLEAAHLDRRLALAGQPRALAFSPDGKSLAVAEAEPGVSGAVRIYDAESGAATPVFEPAQPEILAIAFSPDGNLLAASGDDALVRIWSTAEKKLVATLKDHSGAVTSLAFSPDGKMFASGSLDRTLRLWDTAEWKTLVDLPQVVTEPVIGVAFSPDSEILAFATAGDAERALRTYRTENAWESKENDPVSQRRRANHKITRTADLWSCTPQALVWVPRRAGEDPQRFDRMATACTDKGVRLLGQTGNFISNLSGHQDWVYAVAASPDGNRIASGSGDGTVKLWNRSDGALLATLLQLAPRQSEWAIVTPRGFFAASRPGALEWKGAAKPAADQLTARFDNVQAVRDILAGRAVPAPGARR